MARGCAPGGEYLQHECLTSHFYITHFAGGAVLFNQDTCHSDIKVKSIHLHDTRNGQHLAVTQGQKGWVLQAVISRALFRRILRDGKSYFTMMSLHINNRFAKKRGMRKNLLLTVRTVMLQEQVDMVAGDFNRAANQAAILVANASLLVPPGTTFVGTRRRAR